jgi:hypothetical protein
MKKTNAKKEIPAKTVVKALITGFVSYGIIISFLLFVVESVAYNAIDSASTNAKILVISLPLFFAIIQYLIIHLICRLSTIDLFKKCKTKSDNLTYIVKKMNLFFLICVIFLLVVLNFILYFGLSDLAQSIEIASAQEAKVFSEEYTAILKDNMLADYNEQKSMSIVIFFITELSLLISFMSLVPYQKKMILEYNETGRRIKNDEEKTKEKSRIEKAVPELKNEEILSENENTETSETNIDKTED